MKTALLSSLLIFQLASYGQNKTLKYLESMPSYSEVCSYLIETHTLENVEANEYLHFAKKPDGWYVFLKNNSYEVISQEYLIWNKKYRKIKAFTPSGPCTNQSILKNCSKYGREIDFTRHPYFGYKGWPQDVIDNLESLQADLNDTLLYGIGRAYGALATTYTTNQFYYSTKPAITAKPGGGSLTKPQLDSLIYLNRKAIEFYEKTEAKNPDFCVVVGRINTKVSNEYVDLYFKLWMLQDIHSAEAQLPANLYTDNMVSSAKNLLNSCSQDAILLTNGDNDTYPLMYVQKALGYRTDISVINISMLGVFSYFDATKRDPNRATINYTLNFVNYKGTTHLPYILTPNDGDISSFVRLDSLFQTNDTIPNNIGNHIWLISQGKNTYRAQYNKGRYFMKYRFLAFDLMMSNPGRPIAFASQNIAKELGLEDHSYFNGFGFNSKSEQKSLTNEDRCETANSFLSEHLVSTGYDRKENYTWSSVTDQFQNSLSLNNAFLNHLRLLMDCYNDETVNSNLFNNYKENLDALYQKCFSLHADPSIIKTYEQVLKEIRK